MNKKNILFVFGTRPEVIKLAPVILELKKYPDKYNVIICNTEQQKELSNQTLAYFNLKADINLDCMRPNQSLAEVQSRILTALDSVFSEKEIDATIVQGDTMTVLCGALTSFYRKIPVFHVEAGLRSYDIYEPFPEEVMRQMTSRVAELNFAPTEKNKNALLKEDISEKKIYVTGNTVIDALFCLSEDTMNVASEFYKEKGIPVDDKVVLITAHRRENHGERINRILDAIEHLVNKYQDHHFIIPVHPNPNVKDKIHSRLEKYSNVYLLKPLDYPYLVYLMKNAKLILTDSGGIQEEAPSFGCPTLVMRYETERQEGIDAGVSVLVGADYDKIVNLSCEILDKTKSDSRLKAQNPYGTGNSSKKIEEIISKYFNENK
ncbi:TPA: UDP-N-acetylglucosamine 2-epimerase (non-hydrolyzing) [Candidatus Gastranaerophilales bacterium HUM_6]|jgi:UDP-N-acetylglucosamine 2-epimerase (non-hydrolysing)|nr:UDP-N-acetylglucosamine 2-epimerase (non-hydrolyzing) [bacterium]CDE92713.1 uDP-N-acetylglucosamine 2-epimerase [Fusobacterium sp. CAG:815]DAA89841.1 MAG TPA: UDP-N-acetylglucosamine 2-epimerase (non-hydrolyzing) [Candidatus Gastranaerophilales bacterium HUM_7]DAA93405.1 MAG TPA: UDP-N-acetylglucosamine 2-epimerase (non-hydrolyzing) [Candidatus Gastranaerophilales bacterium HUM_6]DAB03270.1 MAG TPA: UDP-N-acetylglucosamine 2-epimerase (non-hydrolyzing) [Candidatus Gastranaerophilales bacteri